MGEEKTEMVTISYEVSVEFAEELLQSEAARGPWQNRKDACRKALDARNSLYGKWQERVGADLTSGEADGLYCYLINDCGYGVHSAKLMAAAPELVDALVGLENYEPLFGPDDGRIMAYVNAAKAIRSAVPDDVADDILGIVR